MEDSNGTPKTWERGMEGNEMRLTVPSTVGGMSVFLEDFSPLAPTEVLDLPSFPPFISSLALSLSPFHPSVIPSLPPYLSH